MIKRLISYSLIVILLVGPLPLLSASRLCHTPGEIPIRTIDETPTTTPLSTDSGTEYWALIVACNEFVNAGTLLHNNRSAEDLTNMLLISDHWRPDHIKVLTGKNASTKNIVQGLRWLDEMDDEDDICLFYISTHGSPFINDLPPKDEEDGVDEVLLTYSTDQLYFPSFGLIIHIPWISYLFDDELNILLSMLDAQGVCAIINACYAGGHNDNPWGYTIIPPQHPDNSTPTTISATTWMKEFAEELSGSGRVVLMSSQEDTTTRSYLFIYNLIEALHGYGDTNQDQKVSAEEAFTYAAPKTATFLEREYNFPQVPQWYDEYPGDLILTTVELPPTHPNIKGPLTGTTNTSYTYEFSSVDPEGDLICYFVDWGDGTEEWTPLYPSGEHLTLTHSWDTEGTYNIWYENKDQHGAEQYESSFLERTVVSITNDKILDQRQITKYEDQCFNDARITVSSWLAQSFIPTQPVLSQVDLEVFFKLYYNKDKGPLFVSLRENLTGENLAIAMGMPQSDIADYVIPAFIRDLFFPRTQWVIVDFPDVEVTPGRTYYLVCHFETNSVGIWTYAGIGYNDPDYVTDPYPHGHAYVSMDRGKNWDEHPDISDFCFITYGTPVGG